MKKFLSVFVFSAFILLAVPTFAAKYINTGLTSGEDINNEYIFDYGYDRGKIRVKYEPIMDNFRAEIKGNHLKPGFTYQVKFIGTPSCAGGNDETNELIGYAGRWYCPDCDGSTASKNRSDAQYEANQLLPIEEQECIHGYLVFDYFTADSKGRVSTEVTTDGSYHVLWCGSGNDDLYNVDISSLPCSESDIKCVTPKLCDEENVIPQIERLSFDQLPEGEYTNLQIALTEESFHQNCGTWATVLWNDVEFTIDR